MLLIIPKTKGVKGGVMTLAEPYKFTVKKWWGTNDLLLCARVEGFQMVNVYSNDFYILQ